MTVRVLSYNIHKGFSLNASFVLKEIRQAIRQTDADIVFLQEVLGHHDQHSKKIADYASQFEYLADSIWPHFAYGKNAIYNEGHHGNAILSRWPIVRYHNTDISNHLLERRGLLDCTVELPKRKTLRLACLHLDLTHHGRWQQMQRIESWVKHVSKDEPIIMAGDFNDWRNRVTQELSDRCGIQEVFTLLHGRPAKSFPSWFPVLSLDRVFFRHCIPNQAMTLRKAPWRNLSDHLPLIADFTV